MIVSDIDKYITMGKSRNICVYRKRLQELDVIIMSIYIIRSGSNGYALQVVFDPVGMIDHGEGWVWETTPLSLDEIIKIIEKYSNSPIEKWDNVSKTGELEEFLLTLDRDETRKQNKDFIHKYKGGEAFLPMLPQVSYWEVTPYPKN